MKLLYLLIVSLLASGLAVAELVDSFDKCKEFFLTLKGKTYYPTVLRDPENNNRYRLICQTHNNKNHFATLYDTGNKIPVYSAYVLHQNNGPRPNNWRTDPDISKEYQATNADYERSKDHGFQKGHLFPVHHAAPESMEATMTLTNAAPQAAALNQGQWKANEAHVAKVQAGSQCFIVTGTVPGGYFLNGRVNIPQYFWSAYCCLDNNGLKSDAFVGTNDLNKTKAHVVNMTVKDLEAKLGETWPNFRVFDGQCDSKKRKQPAESPNTSIEPPKRKKVSR